MKKQIVFIESNPTIYTYKVARALKLTNKYETILVSFSKVDEDFYKIAYNKIINIDITHKISLRNLINFPRVLLSKNFRRFIMKIKNLNPLIFQITGPDLFTYLSFFLIRKKIVIYFAYDIWEFYNKKLSYKNPGIKEFFQKKIEKFCFKMANGILHKGPVWELNSLSYSVKKPNLSLIPGCMDEWTYKPIKKKKNKELHLVYAGGPLSSDSRIPFIKIVKIITSQKIHFHTFGSCVDKSEEILFKREARDNIYFHFHKSERTDNLNKIIKNYDFGIIPDFYEDDKISSNSLHMQVSMPNKVFNYIEAGIPSIVPIKSGFLFKIIKETNSGFGIVYEDLKNIRKIIEEKNYAVLQENVKNAQEKILMSKLIKKLEEFYDRIIKSHSF